jgi:hypothetical protein
MMRSDIRSAGDLVAYLTDCTLATVADLSMKKSASKSETRRQISIAQTAINKGLQLGVSFDRTRAAEVISKHGGDCNEWAETYRRHITPVTVGASEVTK